MKKSENDTLHLHEKDDLHIMVNRVFDDDPARSMEQTLRESLQGFRQDLEDHPDVRRLASGGGSGFFTMLSDWLASIRPLAWATGLGTGAVGLLILLGLFFSAGAPTWAEVAERFRSARFLSATIYIRDGLFERPRQMEMWLGEGGKLRMRAESQIIFAASGQIEGVFDLKTRQAGLVPDSQAFRFIKYMAGKNEFSLDSIVEITSGRLMEVSPKLNADAVVSRDMSVFDIQLEDSDAWIRVWALSESRLPCRLVLNDPGSGESMDIIFTYANDQPSQFFDASAFAHLLNDPSRDIRSLVGDVMENPAE